LRFLIACFLVNDEKTVRLVFSAASPGTRFQQKQLPFFDFFNFFKSANPFLFVSVISY